MHVAINWRKKPYISRKALSLALLLLAEIAQCPANTKKADIHLRNLFNNNKCLHEKKFMEIEMFFPWSSHCVWFSRNTYISQRMANIGNDNYQKEESTLFSPDLTIAGIYGVW